MDYCKIRPIINIYVKILNNKIIYSKNNLYIFISVSDTKI